MTPAQRKAAERKRNREKGLIRAEYWLTPDQKPRVTEFVAKIRNEQGVTV